MMTYKRFNPSRTKLIRPLALEGLSDAEIAKKLNMNPSTVRDYIRRYDLRGDAAGQKS